MLQILCQRKKGGQLKNSNNLILVRHLRASSNSRVEKLISVLWLLLLRCKTTIQKLKYNEEFYEYFHCSRNDMLLRKQKTNELKSLSGVCFQLKISECVKVSESTLIDFLLDNREFFCFVFCYKLSNSIILSVFVDF